MKVKHLILIGANGDSETESGMSEIAEKHGRNSDSIVVVSVNQVQMAFGVPQTQAWSDLARRGPADATITHLKNGSGTASARKEGSIGVYFFSHIARQDKKVLFLGDDHGTPPSLEAYGAGMVGTIASVLVLLGTTGRILKVSLMGCGSEMVMQAFCEAALARFREFPPLLVAGYTKYISVVSATNVRGLLRSRSKATVNFDVEQRAGSKMTSQGNKYVLAKDEKDLKVVYKLFMGRYIRGSVREDWEGKELLETTDNSLATYQ